MNLTLEDLNKVATQAAENAKGKTADELLEEAVKHHRENIQSAVQQGYIYKTVLIKEGSEVLADLSAKHGISIMYAHAAIKVFDVAITLAETIQDNNELLKQVGLSPEFDHYDALFHQEILAEIEGMINE